MSRIVIGVRVLTLKICINNIAVCTNNIEFSNANEKLKIRTAY
jgi:hypothetical protein